MSDRGTAIDHGSFLDLDRNGFYKTAEHKYRKSCSISKINDDQSSRSIQFQDVCDLGKSKHYHLEWYNHGKQAQHVHGFCQRVGNTVDVPGTHGGTEQNYRNRKYCDK